MSPIEESRWVAEAVAATYREAGLPWPPAPGGPMPLDALMQHHRIVHEEIAGLNRAVVANQLGRWGVRWDVGPEPDEPLAGFAFANAGGGYLFVRRDDPLPRRRFTAAHEFGHYCLHLAPALAKAGAAGVEVSLTDGESQVEESGEAELKDEERQANRFAAELLMPESVCRELHRDYAARFGPVDRFLRYRIAADLLVSAEAAAWRLFHLRLAEKPSSKAADETEAG